MPQLNTNKVEKRDNKWYVFSHDGKKKLGGPYETEDEAKSRLKEIEHFSHNHFSSVTVNLRKPEIRRDTMEGKEYLVVPMVMLTEGVHEGSSGPLFYPAEELEKVPVVWNHKPIVVYHPMMNGKPISACDPDVITTHKVGVIMRARFENGKLKAEAWLEPGRVEKIDKRILEALEAKKAIEVSTGVFTDNDGEPGEWNGERYISIARNYRPDHLAILPDQKGACSIEDGAGLNVNSGIQGNRLIGQHLIHLLSLVRNELSYNEMFERMSRALCGTNSTSSTPPNRWPLDIYSDHVVYQEGDKIFKQPYVVGEEEKIELVGTPVEVRRVVSYTPVSSSVVTGNRRNDMDKDKMVQELIKNSKGTFDEEDTKVLSALSEVTLKKFLEMNQASPPDGMTDDEKAMWDKMTEDERREWLTKRTKKEPPPEEPTGNQEDVTVEQYIAKAPEGMRDMLSEGLVAHRAEKTRLVQVITANKANTFPVGDLQKKSVSELRSIAALATGPKKVSVGTVNFAGQADVVQTNNAEEPLLAPHTFDGEGR